MKYVKVVFETLWKATMWQQFSFGWFLLVLPVGFGLSENYMALCMSLCCAMFVFVNIGYGQLVEEQEQLLKDCLKQLKMGARIISEAQTKIRKLENQ